MFSLFQALDCVRPSVQGNISCNLCNVSKLLVLYSERVIVLCLVSPAPLFFLLNFSYVNVILSHLFFCNRVCVCVFSRCFGLLLSPGRNVKNSDMHLLDLVGDNCMHAL